MDRLSFFRFLSREWVNKNEDFFGIPVESETESYSDIINKFPIYERKYWNNENKDELCTICKALLANEASDMSDFIPYNEGDEESGFFIADTDAYITVYGWFKSNNFNRSPYPVFIIPRILDSLEWRIKTAQFIPRNVIKRNTFSLNKIDNKVILPGKFEFDCETEEVNERSAGAFSPKNIEGNSLKFMKAFCPDFKEDESIEVFVKHLKDLPNSSYRDIINYNFYDSSFFFEKIEASINMINPKAKRPGNLCGTLVKSGRSKNTQMTGKMAEDEPDCLLILNTEKSIIYSMDNYRSALYSKKTAHDNFYFENTSLFFDAFKTSTSKSAGKIRTMLDDVFIGDDNLLYKRLPDGRLLNQYEAYKKYYIDGDSTIKTKSLSCLTETPFCNNNDPKRIMMTSKSLGQSIPLKRNVEHDPVTHSIIGRVVFGDFKGFTNGDAIVVSKSFAKKLESPKLIRVFIQKKNEKKWNIYNSCWDSDFRETKRDMTIEELVCLLDYTKNDLNRYSNIRIVDSIEVVRKYGNVKNRTGVYISISVTISFKVADKLTNLHGSKGVCSLILDDEQMPRLTEKVGNMEPGPFDIIISSYGIAKRGNIGQLIEAYARMKGFPLDSSTEDIFKKDYKKYSKAVVELNGKKTVKQFGLQEILRLQHLSISHASFSGINKPIGNMLNFGEMENLFMSAHHLYSIQKEISQRSQKFYERESNVNNIILNKESKNLEDLDFNMELLSILYTLGYDIQIEKD